MRLHYFCFYGLVDGFVFGAYKLLYSKFNRPGDYDAFGQDKCPALGRENELTEILKTIKDEKIKNVVSLTSDVHFTAAISYNPKDAVFKEFDPFMEFVIGPIHAGSFGPGELDGTFGPTYDFRKCSFILLRFRETEKSNTPLI